MRSNGQNTRADSLSGRIRYLSPSARRTQMLDERDKFEQPTYEKDKLSLHRCARWHGLACLPSIQFSTLRSTTNSAWQILQARNQRSGSMQAVEQHAEDIATFMKCIPGVMTFVLLGYMCISLILDYRTWIVFCKYSLAKPRPLQLSEGAVASRLSYLGKGSAPGWNNPQGYCLFRLQLFYLMLVGDKGPRDTSALREYKDQKARLSLKEARMGSRPMMIPWWAWFWYSFEPLWLTSPSAS